MKEIVIKFGAREVAALFGAALLFGGGFATVSAFNGGATTQGLPMVLPYQGTLAKDGMPVDGTQPNVVFKLHTSESGAARLWSSDSRTLDVKDGKFAVTLGDANDATSLEPHFFENAALYVSVTIDGTEMSPRQRVAPTPQAILAAKARHAEDSLHAAEASGSTGALAAELAGIDSRISANESSLVRATAPGREISTLGLFCGTSVQTNGSFTHTATGTTYRGYEAAKKMCEDACGMSPTAHMCSGHELALSFQVGLQPSTSSWYSGMYYTYGVDVSSGTINKIDNSCSGWTNYQLTVNNQTRHGSIINVVGTPYPDHYGCSDTAPIACCD